MINLLRKIKRRVLPVPDERTSLLKKMPKNAVCAEIGSWKGDFAQRILDVTYPQKLYLLDPYKYVSEYKNAWYGALSGSQERMDEIYQSVVNRFSDQIKDGRVEIIRNCSVNGLQNIDDESLDWIYIDGNHTYVFVKDDLRLSWQKVKTGGFITGDDYGIEGWWDSGVTRAVDEFIANKEDSVKKIAIEGTQFILQKVKE